MAVESNGSRSGLQNESTDKLAHEEVDVAKNAAATAENKAFKKGFIQLSAARKSQAEKPDLNTLREKLTKSRSTVKVYIRLLVVSQKSKWWFLKNLSFVQRDLRKLKISRENLEAEVEESEIAYEKVRLELERLQTDAEYGIKLYIIESKTKEVNQLKERLRMVAKAKAEIVELKARFEFYKEAMKKLEIENAVLKAQAEWRKIKRKREEEKKDGTSTGCAQLWWLRGGRL